MQCEAMARPGACSERASSPGRPVVGMIALALLLAACGTSSSGKSSPSSSASSAPTPSAPPSSTSTGNVSGAARGVTAVLRAGTHSPTANRPWPIQFTVSRSGHAVRASVSYEYLFAGQVVARRSHYTFTGHFSDVFVWPSAAVGYPLTFRAVVMSDGTTIDLDYAVQVSA
jgi:hypothetical protein